jgi:hypothetical protein
MDAITSWYLSFFKEVSYTKDNLRLLEKEKRRLSMKYHPDKGWRQGSFIAMMKEYEVIKQAVETYWHYEQKPLPRNKNWNPTFYSGKTTMEEDIQAQKERLEKMRQEERAEKHSVGRLGAYLLDILSGSKVQTALLAVSFPLIFRFGLPYGIEGVLVLFSIHTLIACLLGKNLLALISIMAFSLEMKHYYEPFVSFEVWNTIWNTVNFWIFGVIVSFIARVKPREKPMDWDGLWTKAKEKI